MEPAQVIAGLIYILYLSGTIRTQEVTTTNAKFKEKYDKFANSAEFDPAEAKVVYKISKNEKFIPPFADNRPIKCNPKTYYRNLDGSCNNLENPSWGKPNSTYIVREPPIFGDGKRTPRRGFNGNNLPGARKVRTELFPTGSKKNEKWNVMAMIFGQFFAHDMSLLREPTESFDCCTDDYQISGKEKGRFCFPIKVPDNDATMGADGIRCLNFSRTVTNTDLGFGEKDQPSKQINTVTAYLDLSNVYGLSDEMSDELRSFKDGKLKVEIRNNRIYAPTETSLRNFCPCNPPGENMCYKTGDSRSNQNPHLAIMQIMFVREHNRICDELKKLNPHWNDKRLFQEARRILIAMYQRITYYEWLPIFNGRESLEEEKIIYDESKIDFIDDYENTTEPAIYNEHAHAGFRFFHTHIEGQLEMQNSARMVTDNFVLADWWGRPGLIESDSNNPEELTIGMVTQNLQETDNLFVVDVSDQFFRCGKKFGIDLKAADIQRDRDHGLRFYNDYRKSCGLKEATSFDDYKDLIPSEYVERLKKLYEDYRDVDVSVGAALENLVPGAEYGPTFLCLVNDQFQRTRVSDRFWYESPRSGFTIDQLHEIRKATISRMFCDSGDGITQIQAEGFELFYDGNPLKPCSEIPKMSLLPWKDNHNDDHDYPVEEHPVHDHHDDDDYHNNKDDDDEYKVKTKPKHKCKHKKNKKRKYNTSSDESSASSVKKHHHKHKKYSHKHKHGKHGKHGKCKKHKKGYKHKKYNTSSSSSNSSYKKQNKKCKCKKYSSESNSSSISLS